MTLLLALAATIAGSLGALILYLAAPHQKLRREPLPKQPALVAGGLLLVASLALYLQVAGPATSVFILFTLLMTLWSVPPLGFAFARARKGGRK